MKTLPAVTFAQQAIVPNYPNKLYECIVMTPELQAWAIYVMPTFKAKSSAAHNIEKLVLHSSRGEHQWTANGGHQVALSADRANQLFSVVELLSKGRIASSWVGWVTPHDWKQIVSALT